MTMKTGLQVFKRQFLQLVPLKEISWPGETQLKSLKSQDWLYSNLFDSDAVTYLPSVRYRLQILKELVERIQSQVRDPEQDVPLSFIFCCSF
jgi:hypothetical protein